VSDPHAGCAPAARGRQPHRAPIALDVNEGGGRQVIEHEAEALSQRG
jgi:hypothetical protein